MKQTAETDDGRSDEYLLRRGVAGDEDAFLSLYARHSPAVLRFALHMSGSRDVAEEVLQEVFLAILSKRSEFDKARGNLQGFLIGMARNHVRRLLRLRRRNEPVPTSCIQADSDEKSSEGELEVLRQAILALPENYRAVTVLCELEEMTYVEAAQQLGCAVGTVRSRLHRAKAILEAKLRRSERCPIATVS